MRLTKSDNQVVSLNTLILDQQNKLKENENSITDLRQTNEEQGSAAEEGRGPTSTPCGENFTAQSKSLEMVRQRNAELDPHRPGRARGRLQPQCQAS